MVNSQATSGLWSGLLDYKSRRFRIELAALLVITVVLIFWTLTPNFVSQSAWGGEVIGAGYWGLGWYKEPGILGRNYFKLTARNAEGTEEIVVNYRRKRGRHSYRLYKNGRLRETGLMFVSSGHWTRNGMSPPRITLRSFENRIVLNRE